MINMTKTPMANLRKEAKLSLAKHGLEADGKGGIKVRLVLDHSWSMKEWYWAEAVQRLTEQVLGLAAALDDDGTIETWYFGDDVSRMFEVSLNQSVPHQAPGHRTSFLGRSRGTAAPVDPYYVGWVDRTHESQPWGMTNYVAPIRAVTDFARGEEEPTLVIFQTDGGPNSRAAADKALRDVSGDNVFFAFVVFGTDDPDPRSAASYLHHLDELDGRVRDNASAYIAGDLATYARVPDSAVYDGVLGDFIGQWLPQVL